MVVANEDGPGAVVIRDTSAVLAARMAVVKLSEPDVGTAPVNGTDDPKSVTEKKVSKKKVAKKKVAKKKVTVHAAIDVLPKTPDTVDIPSETPDMNGIQSGGVLEESKDTKIIGPGEMSSDDFAKNLLLGK